MMRIAQFSYFAILISACAVDAGIPRVPQAVPGLPLSVLLYQPGPGTFCSAVAVGPTTALTARHCIGGHPGGLRSLNGDVRAVRSAVRDPEGHDKATLTVDDPFEAWVPLASVPIAKGDLVQLWGYGCSEGLAVRAGEAAGDHSVFAVACGGDSGGPVVGFDGVAGIIHGSDGSEHGWIGFTPVLADD